MLYHYHTGTMTSLNDRAPGAFVEMSPNDANRYDVADGETVEIASRRGAISAVVQISSKATDGTVFIPFHFAKGSANQLTNAALDPVSGIPELKVCAVKLSKTA
jgi:formate dehydrogenase major subunit